MKILLLGIVIAIFLPSNEIIGTWNTNKENTKIEIYEENGEYFGRIISSNNINAKKGTLILRNLKYKNGKWKGKLYSLKFDKLLDAEMSVYQNTLQITIDAGFKRKMVEWEKEK